MERARHSAHHAPAVTCEGLDVGLARLPTRDLVDDASTVRPMITSLHIGGHSDDFDDPGRQNLLELALTD